MVTGEVEIVEVGDDHCVLRGKMVATECGGRHTDVNRIEKKNWKDKNLQLVVDAPWAWEVGTRLKDSKSEFEITKVDEEHFWIFGSLVADPARGLATQRIKKSHWKRLQLEAA